MMRNVSRKIFSLLAFASVIGVFGFYFRQADIGYSTVCAGVFLLSMAVVSRLTVKPADAEETINRKKSRVLREAREMEVQILSDNFITLGTLLGPTTILYGVATIFVDAIAQPGSTLTSYVANTLFNGAKEPLDCAKSFLTGIAYAVMALTVIAALASVVVYLYTHWYRIKLFWKTKIKHEEVSINE